MHRVLLAGFLISLLLLGASHADDNSAVIAQSLDKVVNLDVNGMMPAAIKKIGEDTGVPIEVPRHVYDLLPWGEQTNIKATIRNKTLREAMTAITRKLGLNWELQPQSVRLLPRQPLERIGRRATIQELATLDMLDTTPFGQTPPPGKPTTVEWVVNAVDQKLAETKSSTAVEFRPHDKAKVEQTINLQRDATLNDALREITKQTDLTWYPWDKNVVVVTKEDQIVRQLDRTVTRRFVGAEIAQVLSELSVAADVQFDLEPGALQRVPADFRKITLVLDNARIRQALEDIRGVTGLDYVVKSDNIYLWNQNPPVAAVPSPPSPILATLQLDNGMSLFLRAGDLPPDLLDYCEHKKLAEFKRLRQQMSDEHFTATTQPTTRP